LWYARADAGYRAFGSCTAARIGFVAQVAHQHHPPSSGEYAKVLENPCRDAWQKPQEVVSVLARIRTKYVKLTGNAQTADVRAGHRDVEIQFISGGGAVNQLAPCAAGSYR